MKKNNKKVIGISVMLIIVIILIFIIRTFIFTVIHVDTENMETTIMRNKNVLGYKIAYFNHKPQRGDIISFYSPVNEDILLIDRIIGLPNETITIEDNKVFVNNALLQEHYINVEWNNTEKQTFHVPDNSYFVLGDNRDYSDDSRNFTDDTNKKNNLIFISKEKIHSKILFKLDRKPNLYQ